MLQPKRLKHRKFQRGRMKGTASGGAFIAHGDFALQAQEPCWMTARQIEAARRAMVHHLKRGGKVWIRVFPDKPVTKKPAEVRMGSGKGAPDHSGTDPVRARGCRTGAREGSDAARRLQAADQDEIPASRGRGG